MNSIANLITPDKLHESKELFRKWKKPILIVVLSLIVLIVIMIIISNNVAKKDYDIVSISNYSELSQNPPNETKDHLKSGLYNLIKRHFDTRNTSGIKATIRPDSIINNTSGRIKSVEFILDVDDYKQSYYVSMAWSDVEEVGEDISIECVSKDQSKYPDDVCYGRYYSSDSVMVYLPYSGQLPSGESFEAKYYGKNDNFETISITISGCGQSDLFDEAVADTKNYLEEVSNVDTNQLIIRKEIEYSNCD